MVAEKVFAVIAETTRRDILAALAQESKAVGQLVDELGVSQPTVSKHLRVLREAGVVTMRAQGQKRFYGINTEPLTLVATWLESLGAGIGPVTAAAPRPTEVRMVGAAAQSRKQPAGSGHATDTHASASAIPTSATAAPAAAIPASATAALAAPIPGDESIRENDPAAAEPPTQPAAQRAAAVESATVADSNKTGKLASTSLSGPALKTRGADLVAHSSVVQSHDLDGSVQGQISRGVGRAANKAADLLANLPAFRRRKD